MRVENTIHIFVYYVISVDCSVSGDTLQYRLKESVSHRRT